MAKLIAVSEEAYSRLSKLKGKDRSFTKIIIELTEEKKTDISDLFGALNMSPDKVKAIKETIKEERKGMFARG
jgi:predicted CopG family antitoxin